MIAQELTISFWDSTGPDIIIHQGEKGREIEFIPDISLPNGAAAQIVIVKPDKTFTISDCAINNHDHIIAEIPEQAGAVIGLAHYIIKIMDTDTLIYSASGGLWVDDALLTDAMIESVAEVNGYVFPDDFLTSADLNNYALKSEVPEIESNPSGTYTADLDKILINGIIYKIPSNYTPAGAISSGAELPAVATNNFIYSIVNDAGKITGVYMGINGQWVPFPSGGGGLSVRSNAKIIVIGGVTA